MDLGPTNKCHNQQRDNKIKVDNILNKLKEKKEITVLTV